MLRAAGLKARNPRDFFVHDRYLGSFLDFGSLKTAARYAKTKFGCAPAGDCVYIEQDEAMVPVNAARPHLARRVRGLRNPFNATKPAEWATMSKKLRKAWNRKHWRPEQWKCDLALKREATRLEHRRDGSTRGKGLEQLAEKLSRQNPPPTLDALLRYPPIAKALQRAPAGRRAKILAKLEQAAERAHRVRRSNPATSYRGWILAPKSAERQLLDYGIRLGSFSDGEWNNCLVPASAMTRLDKHWGDWSWGLEPTRSVVASMNPKRGRKKTWAEKVERERRKLAWSDRKRIEREELASGFAVNPRRRRRR